MMNCDPLQITTQAVGGASLLGDVSTGVFRPLVPIQCREVVFQSLHSIHHPVVRATSRLIAARFCWPQMAKAITLMARACLFCQRGKVHKHFHQCCGSESGIRCLFDPWIRDPGWVESQHPDPGSGMNIEQPGSYFLELRNHFFSFLRLKYLNSLIRIRDRGWKKVGSGIRDTHPGSATLTSTYNPAEIPVPHRRFAHIHIDLVGLLPPSRGHTYLFTNMDRTSRWPEDIQLPSITATDCARALFAGWVSRFGVPATITSDRGAQFTSTLWAALCSLLNIKHSPTTAYHPQSNGLVERFDRRLKDALRVSRRRRRLA
jgi:hypothetical protein